MEQDNLDLLCMRALKIDPEMERVTRTCASIIVHAHALARDAASPSDPIGRHDGALRIVELTRSLYSVMPSRPAIEDIVDDFLDDAGLRSRERRAVEGARATLIHRLWRHFQHGPEDISLKAGATGRTL